MPTNSTAKSVLILVVDGGAHIGTLMRRREDDGDHALCFEAYGRDDVPIGVFSDEHSAVEALWKRAHNQAGAR
jgi:hypothetical protein